MTLRKFCLNLAQYPHNVSLQPSQLYHDEARDAPEFWGNMPSAI